MTKVYEDVIMEIINELHRTHAEYQREYFHLHGKEDTEGKHIYKTQVELCERIRKQIILRERV